MAIIKVNKKKNFILNEFTRFNQDSPTLAKFSNSDFIVVWQSESQDGSGTGIYAKIIDQFGNIKKREFKVNDYTKFDQKHPHVATFLDGGFIITWQSSKNGSSGTEIFAKLYNKNGDIVKNEFQINSFTRFNQEHPKVTTFFDGKFLVVWHSQAQDKSGKAIVGQYFSSDGNKFSTEFIVNINTRFDQMSPDICSLPRSEHNEAIIVWQSQAQDRSGKAVIARKININHQSDSQELVVNTNTRFDQQNPAVECLNNGKIIVAWESQAQDGSGLGIYAQGINNDLSKFGPEFKVNNRTKFNQKNPKISAFLDNQFIICWTSDIDKSGSSNLYAQQYNPDLTRIGNQFKVNNQLFYDISGSDLVVALNDGTFLTVWTGFDQSGSGIIAQSYTQQLVGSEQYKNLKEFSEFNVSEPLDYKQNEVAIANYGYNTIFVWTIHYHDNGSTCDRIRNDQHDYISSYLGSQILYKIINFETNSSSSVYKLNDFINHNQFNPQIIVKENNVLVSWTSSEYDGSGLDIHAKLIDLGSKAFENLSFSGCGLNYNPKITNECGNLPKIRNEPFKRSKEFIVNDYRFSDQHQSHSSFVDKDKLVIVWTSDCQDGYGTGVFGKIYNISSKKPIPVDSAIKFDSSSQERSCYSLTNKDYEFQINGDYLGYQFEPKVSAIKNGFAVIWTASTENNENDTNIFIQKFNNDAVKIGNEIKVNTHSTNKQEHGSIASFTDNSGRIIITWTSNGYYDGYSTRINIQIFDSDLNKIGTEQTINSHLIGNQDYSRITIIDSNKAIITWSSTEHDTSGSAVIAQVIDLNGKKIGSEIRLNDNIFGDQFHSDIIAYPNSTLLSSWINANSSSTDMIVAKRFIPAQDSTEITGLIFDESF